MKDQLKIIDQLSPIDALVILKTLAQDDQIAARIAEVATAHLADNIDVEEIALELFDDLEHLEVEEVWDRAGPKRHGYVDTGEAAEEMIREVMEAYLEELKKYQALGMNTQANQMCMGLLFGLYKFENESTSQFKDWASDAPSSFAWVVVKAWKTGTPGQADIAAVKTFIEEKLGGWQAYLLQS
ncbi:MAG: hypothetical protein JXB30_18515 [Anaerolineae bacterium]|nr:hypothetical protein [Anaerolineae bacterium]